MAIKKSELYSSIWKSCDELRGGMDASQYKDYILILLFGQTFLGSAATRKLPMTISSGIAAIIFALNGAIFYPMGMGLFISSSVGAYIAANYSDRIGNVWIKRSFFFVVFFMGVKLLI